ncbi:unnamed protein product [marine sediment metagenome]|uniref:Uncharacterized protein n=1 Tax=marine sediment metagenome TaxID=412755 RepID=X0RY86_9ZZZZ
MICSDVNNISAACVDFTTLEGDYFEQVGRITDLDDDGAPVDLTAFAGTLKMQIKKDVNGMVIKELTEGSGLTVLDTNQLTIAFENDINAGRYVYDIVGIEGGKTITIQNGSFIIND